MQVLDIVTLPASIDSPKRARAAVLRMMEQRGCLCRIDDVAVAVSELVTNVVRHTDSADVRLSVELVASVVRVTVSDSSTVDLLMPEVPVPDETLADRAAAEAGRGLLLVAALTDAWGTDITDADGKHVWFEVSC